MRKLFEIISEAPKSKMRQVKGSDLAPGLYTKVLDLKKLNDKLLEMQAELDGKLEKISAQLGYDKPADKQKKDMAKEIKDELIKQKINAVELRDILLKVEPKNIKPSATKLIDAMVGEVSEEVTALLHAKEEMLTTINHQLHFRKNETVGDMISNAFKSAVATLKNLTSSFGENVNKLGDAIAGGLNDEPVRPYARESMYENYNDGDDVTQMPIIGKVTTKPLEGVDNSTGKSITLPSETFDVVAIHNADYGKVYIANMWYKEHKKIPQVIHDLSVEKYEPINTSPDESVEESSIDFPRPDLSELVWNKEGDSTYVIKPEIEKKITDALAKYPKANLNDLITELHVVGSIGTNQYNDDADVDIHFLMPEGALGDEMTDLEWQQDIKKFFKGNMEELDLYIGSHPMEFYWQLNPDQELLADAFYNVTAKEWVKGPKIVEPSFNPYEKYKDVVDNLQNVLGETDMIIGELKRDVIDYDVIKKALKDAPLEIQSQIKAVLQSKVDEIGDDVDALFVNRKEWIEGRKRASTPKDAEQAMTDIELAKSWDHGNAMFKFVDRYQYMQLIGDLSDMMSDDELDDEEAEKMLQMLSSADLGVK